MADLDALYFVLPVLYDAVDRHQSKSHALNHVLAFGLSMQDRRLQSMMYEKYDVMGSSGALARTVDCGLVQHWMENELRPYLRHGIKPTEYLAVHNGVAATSIYLGTWIPRYVDAENQKIHAFTLQALILLMALQSIALVRGSKGDVMTSAEEVLTRMEAQKELNRWVRRLEVLDERVERHTVACADEENQPISRMDLEFFGHEEYFAALRSRISEQLAAMR
ncbi:hypothetical protein [Vitreimonas sp.]|uniref:hypothetical protein n=1 Tax=Vitreimonas sp. TaxID=3069702 RepID=UPI002EDAFAF5